MDIVKLYNKFDVDFTGKFDGAEYTIKAGKAMVFTREIAEHLAFHMQQAALMRELQDTNTPDVHWTNEICKAKSLELISSMDEVQAPIKEEVTKTETAPIKEEVTKTETAPVKEEVTKTETAPIKGK